MDLVTHLRYFIAVADEESITGAAHRLGIGQPPLSRAIARLEQHFGVALIERGSNRSTLTGAGRMLLPEARDIVAQVANLPTQLQAAGKSQGPRIAVPQQLPIDALLALQNNLRPDCPTALLLPRSLAERERALRDGSADVVLLPDHDGIRVPLGIAYGPHHPLANQPHPHPSDLADALVLLQTEDECLRSPIARGLTQHGFEGQLAPQAADPVELLLRCHSHDTAAVCTEAEANQARLIWNPFQLPERRWGWAASPGTPIPAVAALRQLAPGGIG